MAHRPTAHPPWASPQLSQHGTPIQPSPASKTCLKELRQEALNLGANAVIVVHLAYSEFSGAGSTMLFLVASGTAVLVEPIAPPT